MLQRLWVCHICPCRGGGCSHEYKATQGGWKGCGTKEGCLKRRFSKTRCPLNCEKRLLLVALKKTLKNII